MPPLCTVLAGGLEPESSGGRPITPLGFQLKLTCTPEPGRAPVHCMLAQKHSANHAHSRGKPQKFHQPDLFFRPFHAAHPNYSAADKPESKFLYFCRIIR